MNPKLTIRSLGEPVCETEAAPNQTLLRAISDAGVFLDAPCGGEGRCGKCAVTLTPPGAKTLACRTLLQEDAEVDLPAAYNTQIEVHSPQNREGDRADGGAFLGIAVDIGTTTIAMHLTDIETGLRIATASSVNSQRIYGADVISRIKFSAENGHGKLTKLIREQLGALTLQLCGETGECCQNIRYITIAANTIMQHLAAGYSPVSMGTVPFTPESLFGTETPAWEGFPAAKDASIYYTPAITAYVGGDVTAGLLASGLESNSQLPHPPDPDPSINSPLKSNSPPSTLNAQLKNNSPLSSLNSQLNNILYLDIGTNGEIVLKSGDKYYCCATAAGPAFEGAEIEMGMAAVSGAISHVMYNAENGELKLTIIGESKNTRPVGICGSGLLDSLAVMLETGALDETGRLTDGSRFTIYDPQTPDAPEICITANDIRKLQLAKAAIAAGIQTLLHHAGLAEGDMDALILAGGFGSFLDKNSAAKIGLIPKSLLGKTITLGNTAGEGAAMALCSQAARQTLEAIRSRCEYIELSANRTFNDRFIEQMMFEAE